MKNQRWKVSYLSNVVDLHTEELSGGVLTTMGDSMAIYCVKEEDWYRPVEFELLDGAETLLPYFLPEEFADAWDWMPLEGTPKVFYDRERDILRLYNGKVSAVMSRHLADNLTIGCDDAGRPVAVELTGAAELLLPLMLPLSEEVTPINQEVQP